MKKESCKFRKRVPLPRVVEMDQLCEEIGLPLGNRLTDPICTHNNALFIIFEGEKDNYLCDVCVRDNMCPLGIRV